MSDPIIARQASSLPLIERAAFAERLAGNLRTHVFYATRPASTPSQPEDTSSIPVARGRCQKLAAGMQPGAPLIANLDGFPVRAQLPPRRASSARSTAARPWRRSTPRSRPGRPAAVEDFAQFEDLHLQAERRQSPAAALGRPEAALHQPPLRLGARQRNGLRTRRERPGFAPARTETPRRRRRAGILLERRRPAWRPAAALGPAIATARATTIGDGSISLGRS